MQITKKEMCLLVMLVWLFVACSRAFSVPWIQWFENAQASREQWPAQSLIGPRESFLLVLSLFGQYVGLCERPGFG